jgi:serine protease Do
MISYAAPMDDHSVAALTSLDQAMEALTARVEPTVVNVAVTSRQSSDSNSDSDSGGQSQLQDLPPGIRQFFGQMGPMARPQQPQLEHGIGSGVIISPDGYILTANHVIDGAVNVRVTLHDRRILSARVVGADKLTDLAVLKVDANNLPSIAWGDSTKLEPGQTVLAFGSPFGYFQFSVTRGIVSALNRPNPFADDPRKPGGFIQSDAAINPGNSGGPLVDAHGELVGINTIIATNSGSFAGAGFAVPSQIARATAEQLIKHGKVDHGYLGIGMNDVTPDNAHFFNLPDASGAIISQVTPDSPAARAGLKQGDVIAQLNGEKIVNGGALQIDVSEMAPGTKIALGILRNGTPMTVDVTVGQFHAAGTQVASNDDQSGDAKPGKLGLAVSDLTPDARQQFNVPAGVQGVAVETVRPASPADEAGLQPGDVILEVDRHPTTSANQFVSEVHQNPAGKDVLLLVWSRGNASYRTLHPDAANQNG